MYIKELWHYPVKSMRGERVSSTKIAQTGLTGDRRIVVLSSSEDRVLTSRTEPGLLGLQGSISPDGEPTIDGLPWNSPEARELVRKATRTDVRLVDAGLAPERFDVLPLLVATDGAVEAVEVDMRRLRPNMVVGGVTGHEEAVWAGRQLSIGAARIAVAQRRMRCVMTTSDPDTLVQDLDVLRRIVARTGGKLALDCDVREPGTIAEGDAIVLNAVHS